MSSPAGEGAGTVERECTISAYTAIYNRSHLVHRVYDSLLRQTFRNFEWIVVDDASTEDVEGVIARFAAAGPFFPITYIRKLENTGHTHARGVAIAYVQGQFVINCDSDDAFRPEAFETFLRYWHDIPESSRDSFREVVAHCEDEHGGFVGTRLPPGRNILDADSLEAMYRYKLVGEKWAMQRADLVRQQPHDRGMPPCLVWKPLALRYKSRHIHQVLRTYYRHDDPSSSRPLSRMRTRLGALETLNGAVFTLNYELPYFKWAPSAFLLAAAVSSYSSLALGQRLTATLRSIRTVGGRLLYVAGMPVGVAMYLLKRARGNRWLDSGP